uniref:Uncharacterized protein n=1 Tax=Plectus sambesii TaxID=2011161 RepID=A0A914W3H5_9BILA
MAYVSPIGDTPSEEHYLDRPIEQSHPMTSRPLVLDTARAIAIANWPEHGDYAFNHSDIFQPYWLTFEAPSKPVLFGFGAFVAIAGVLSVIGNGLVCFTFLR